MNFRFLKIAMLLLSSIFVIAGCSDNNAFETPDAGNGTTPPNNNPISQNNFTLLFETPSPAYYNLDTGEVTEVTSQVSVQIGDNNNRVITGGRVIQFRTEWGLIDPSCTTDDSGRCSVRWISGSPDTMPANFLNTIVAYSDGGQESFADLNGNGIFDDGDTFGSGVYDDLEEPYINVDESGFTNTNNGFVSTFTTGDLVIDTINGRDLTGTDTTHNPGDGLFNGPSCAHSTLCSTTRSTITVWEDGSLLLNGGTIYSVGGTISGLTGVDTLVIQNNLADDLTFTADGTYTYTIIGGSSYNITVELLQPTALTCTVANNSGTPTADITNVDITCN